MSDFNSSLPVRTESAGDVIIKVADATIPAQQLTVNADGSVNITDNGGSITVDGTVAITATDLDIRDLAFATDKVDVSGSSVTATVTATNLDIRDLAFATDKVDVSGSAVTVSATNLDVRDLVFATDKVDASGSAVTAIVTATDLDIRDLTHTTDSVKLGDGTDFLAINADGSINVVPQEDPGTEVVNYNTAAALASGATSNHDSLFTTGGRLYQVLSTGSEKIKAEVQVETGSATNVFNTVAVGFNSTATPNIDLTLAKYALVPAGARVRVIRSNRGNQAQDVYSTIVGISN